MATTTTIYATDDTNLRENAPTTNYGGNTLIRVGQYGSSQRRHAVFKFDVSGFTEPSDIIKADFTVTTSSTSGSSTRTMKYARLNQEFVESEATWNISATGISWSGGAGAEGNGEFTQPTYDITVGDVTGAQTVDIKDLVIDAINRRDDVLWLVMCFAPSDSGTGTGSSVIHSSEAVTASERPKIAVTVAERITWTGERLDGDLDEAANWDVGVPTADDYALFNSGSEDVITGKLTCNKAYIGKNYRGSIGVVTELILFDTNELHCNSPYSGVHVWLNYSPATVAEVWISDTSRTLGSYQLNGKYTVNVKRTRHDISLLTTTVTLVDAHTRRATFTCSDEVATVRMSGASATLDDGAGSLTLTNGGYATVSMVDNSGTEITVASNASVRCHAEEVDETIMYSGAIRFMGNEGAPIALVGLTVYPDGLADTRTGAATFTMGSAAVMYGGRLLLDGSMAVAIA